MPVKYRPLPEADYDPPPLQGQNRVKRIKFNQKFWAGLVVAILLTFVSLTLLVKPLQIKISDTKFPDRIVADVDIKINSWFYLKWNNRYLLLPNDYQISVSADGYQPKQQQVKIGSSYANVANIALEPLPGIITITIVNTDLAVETIANSLQLHANSSTYSFDINKRQFTVNDWFGGTHSFSVQSSLYETYTTEFNVIGRAKHQNINIQLTPNWGQLEVSINPHDASVYASKYAFYAHTNSTGNYILRAHNKTQELIIDKPGYKASKINVLIQRGIIARHPPVKLLPADIEVSIDSNPGDGSVLINGEFRGQTPVNLKLNPSEVYQVAVFKAGYQRFTDSLSPNKRQRLNIELKPIKVPVRFVTKPVNSTLMINNRGAGSGNQSIELTAISHQVSISANGYITKTFEFTPTIGSTPVIETQLLTAEEHFWATISETYQSKNNHQFKLFKPDDNVIVGSTESERGRRANEGQWQVKLSHPFYVSLHEVTNEQFRHYNSRHSSGHFGGYSLNGEKQPAANISWQQAALYCNWLSQQENLKPFYLTQQGAISGFDINSDGYRLLTEPEWVWLTYYHTKAPNDRPVYLWGNDVQPPKTALLNIADASAAKIIKFIQPEYNDNQSVSANVGSFPAHSSGLYDLDGNVAEWINDWYQSDWHLEHKNNNLWGPAIGESHTIRGSSWLRGYLPQLRWAYKDLGAKGKNDVGFRIARSVKTP